MDFEALPIVVQWAFYLVALCMLYAFSGVLEVISRSFSRLDDDASKGGDKLSIQYLVFPILGMSNLFLSGRGRNILKKGLNNFIVGILGMLFWLFVAWIYLYIEKQFWQ